MQEINQLIQQHEINKADSLAEATFLYLKKVVPSGNHLFYGAIYERLGRIRYHQGRYNASVDYFKQAREISTKFFGETPMMSSNITNNLALAYFELKDFEKSEYYYRTVAETPEITRDARITAFNGLGHNFLDKSEFDSAEVYYYKALGLVQQMNKTDKERLGICYGNLGAVSREKGDFEQAIDYYQQAIALLSNARLFPELKSYYVGLGDCYYMIEDYGQAINYHRKALQVLQGHYDRSSHHFGLIYNQLGRDYHSISELETAKAYYSAALDQFKSLYGEDHPTIGTVYGNLAQVYDNLGDTSKTAFFYQRSLRIRELRSEEQPEELIFAYNNLAAFYQKQKQFSKAQHFFKKAESLILTSSNKKPNHPDVITIRTNAALNDHFSGNYEQAIEKYKKIIAVYNEQITGLHPVQQFHLLANSYFKMGNTDQAAIYYQKSLDALDYNIGLRGKFYDHETQLSVLRLVANFFLAEALEKNNVRMLRRANKLFERALLLLDALPRQINSTARSTLTGDFYFLFGDAVQTDLALFKATDSLRYLEEAFMRSESARSFKLLKALQLTGAKEASGVSDSLLQREKSLSAAISRKEKLLQEHLLAGSQPDDERTLSLERELLFLRQAMDSLYSNLKINYSELQNRFQPIPLRQLQQELLDEEESFVEYLEGDSSVFIFLVRRDTLLVQEVKKDFPLEDWVQDLTVDGIYGYYADPAGSPGGIRFYNTIDNYTNAAVQLYNKLWQPIAGQITKQVSIVPDGPLNYVPFEALLTESPSSIGQFQDYKFLLFQHQVNYNFSATLWAQMRSKEHREPAQLLLGMAPFSRTGSESLTLYLPAEQQHLSPYLDTPLEPLKATGEEISKINDLIEGDIFIDTSAHLDTFLVIAPRYRILHLSTHAQADQRQGDYAYLAFAAAGIKEKYQRLYAREVYELSLKADLVFLSGCETGTGELQRGEGVISLGRAFAQAGAKSIITSMWAVNDQQTEDLTTTFYELLKTGENKRSALHKAKRRFLEHHASNTKYLHPYFWAAFIGLGDMRPLQF